MNKRQINYDIDKQLTAQRLREAMTEANITLTELSQQSKVSKSSISQYTHGTQSPSNLSASAMSKVLNVSPVWLMGFNVPKSRDEYLTKQNSQIERLARYANYAMGHIFLAETYDNLPPEGKIELNNFVGYLKVKYNVTLKLENKENNNEREHNKEEDQ